MNLNSNNEFYTTLFVDAMIKGSSGAFVNPNRQTICCSRSNNECSFDGELSVNFYLELKDKYDFTLTAIEIYNILLEYDNPLVDFLHFVAGLTIQWEIVAANLKNTVLTSACLAGVPWRTGSILGNGPIPYFAQITSTYGDVLLGYFSYLLRNNKDQILNFGQLQQAFQQRRSECALNVKYWDSVNFNPRRPFSYLPCGPGPKAGTPNVNTNKYPLSLLPQMVWFAFSLDILDFFDVFLMGTPVPNNLDYIKVIGEGKKLMEKRFKIAEYCLSINQKIIQIVGLDKVEELSNSHRSLDLLKTNQQLRFLVGSTGPKIDSLILNLLIELLPEFIGININKSTNVVNVGFKLQEIILNNPNSIDKNLNITSQARVVIGDTIKAISNNNITPNLLLEICRFFNQTTGLRDFDQLFRDLPEISGFKCGH